MMMDKPVTHILSGDTMLTFSILDAKISEIEMIVKKEFGWYSEPEQSIKNIGHISLPVQKGGALPSCGVFYYPAINERKTIFTSNLSDGWDSLLFCITRISNLDYLSFRVLGGEYPLMEMKLVKSGKNVRLVRSMKEESKWDFYQTGDPLWFEDNDHYSKRLISKRVNRDLLLSYAIKNGIDFSSQDFFRTEKESLWINEVRRSKRLSV